MRSTISQFCHSKVLSTFKMISGHLGGIAIGKALAINIYVCMCQDLSVSISSDFNSSLGIEMYGWPLFSGPSIHRVLL